MVTSMARFIIKSEAWSNSCTPVENGSVSCQSYIFNQYFTFTGIKSEIIIPNFSGTYNKSFDSFD